MLRHPIIRREEWSEGAGAGAGDAEVRRDGGGINLREDVQMDVEERCQDVKE